MVKDGAAIGVHCAVLVQKSMTLKIFVSLNSFWRDI